MNSGNQGTESIIKHKEEFPANFALDYASLLLQKKGGGFLFFQGGGGSLGRGDSYLKNQGVHRYITCSPIVNIHPHGTPIAN